MCEVAEVFAPLGEVRLQAGRDISAADLAKSDILLVRSVTRVDSQLLGESRLRFIGSATSGFDHVDRPELSRRGIPFAYASGSNAESVIQYVFSVLVSREGQLERLLGGARVGIIGYGVIGRALEQRFSSVGVDACAYDPWLDSDESPALVDLEEVLSCEVVTIHAEFTHREPYPSFHLLGSPELAQLPRDALLINAGRGAVVDNAALAQFLSRRSDVAAVLDVWEGEPEIDRQLLAQCQYGTPHIAGYSYDGKLLATRMLYRSLCLDLDIDAPEPPLAALGRAEVLDVPASIDAGDTAAFLRWLIARSYDVRRDDAALRAGLDQPGFDGLRRDYPVRRELSAFRVQHSDTLPACAMNICNAFGCRPA